MKVSPRINSFSYSFLTYSLFTAFFVTLQLSGQFQERDWEKGSLSWNDFKGIPLNNTDIDTKINYRLIYTTNTKKIGDTIFYFFNTKNFMLPKISWVKNDSKSSRLLKFNQVIFDIVELQRRGMISELHRIQNFHQAETVFSIRNELTKQRIDQFLTESEKGKKQDVVNRWSKDVLYELDKTPYELLPEVSYAKLGYTAYIGLGTRTFNGRYMDFFTTAYGMSIGMEIFINKLYLNIDLLMGYNSIKNELIEDEIWPKDLKTQTTMSSFNFGHLLLEKGKLKIIPFLGVGLLRFDALSKDQFFYDHDITNFEYVYGFNFEFIYKRKINLVPRIPINSSTLKNTKYKNESSIKLRLYGVNEFSDRGKSLNLSISISGFERKVIVK